jgi:hypothetical protein
VGTASPRHFLLIRRSASDPDRVAFFYCFAPEGTPATMTLLVVIAGRRWPVVMCSVGVSHPACARAEEQKRLDKRKSISRASHVTWALRQDHVPT